MKRGLTCLFILAACLSNFASAACEPEGSGACSYEQEWRAYKRADRRLNAAYAALLRSVRKVETPDSAPPDMEAKKSEIVEAQRLWLKFRDSWCKVSGKLDGGAEIWMQVWETACLTKTTEARAAELERFTQ